MTWYVAICARCEPTLPQPFRDQGERDTWAGNHNAGTGHPVLLVKHDDDDEFPLEGTTMIPGEVGKIRELNRGVEAQVCLGVHPDHGYVIVGISSTSPQVQGLMKQLRQALHTEAEAMVHEARKGWGRRP